eukprot:1181603-Prorocentrum_minimum.AAC.5
MSVSNPSSDGGAQLDACRGGLNHTIPKFRRRISRRARHEHLHISSTWRGRAPAGASGPPSTRLRLDLGSHCTSVPLYHRTTVPLYHSTTIV